MTCKNKNCNNQRYTTPKGGMCPTWEMAHALNNGKCLYCAIKEVKKMRKKDNIIRIKNEIKLREKQLQESIKTMDICSATNMVLFQKFTKSNQNLAHIIRDLKNELKEIREGEKE